MSKGGRRRAGAAAGLAAGFAAALSQVAGRVRAEVELASHAGQVAVNPATVYQRAWWQQAVSDNVETALASSFWDWVDDIADDLEFEPSDDDYDDIADGLAETLAVLLALAGAQEAWVAAKIAAGIAGQQTADDLLDDLGVAGGVDIGGGDSGWGGFTPGGLADLAVSIAWNAATEALGRRARSAGQNDLHKRWNTMTDERVRDSHSELEGVTIPFGDLFDVGGFQASRPGDPSLPVEELANCRCVLEIIKGEEEAGVIVSIEDLEIMDEDTSLADIVGDEGLAASAVELHTHGHCPRCGGWLQAAKWCQRCGGGYAGPDLLMGAEPDFTEAAVGWLALLSLDVGDTHPFIEAAATGVCVICRAPAGGAHDGTLGGFYVPLTDAGTTMAADAGPVAVGDVDMISLEDDQMATIPADAPNPQLVPWLGVIAIEGRPTGDGRLFSAGALYWDEARMPMDAFVMLSDPDGGSGHAGAEIGGRVDRIWRTPSADAGVNEIWAEGVFDVGTDAGAKAAELQSRQMLRGVSVDVDSIEYVQPETEDDLMEWLFGNGVEEYTAGRIRRITICSIPAFIEAQIGLVVVDDTPDNPMPTGSVPAAVTASARFAARIDTVVSPTEEGALVASASAADVFHSRLVDQDPPVEIFARQTYQGFTPATVDAEGRVTGHACPHGEGHIAFGDRYVTAPRTQDGYRHARTGHVLCADGSLVPTGRVYAQTRQGRKGHAPLNANADKAAQWYENMSAVVADVALYDDEFGIQVQGRVRPGITRPELVALRASDLSPDWRQIRGRLECIALAAVNVSGFPNRYDRLPSLVAGAADAGLTLPARVDASTVATGFVSGGELISLVASPVREAETPTAPEVDLSGILARLDVLTEEVARLRSEKFEEEAAALLDGVDLDESGLASMAAALLEGVDLSPPSAPPAAAKLSNAEVSAIVALLQAAIADNLDIRETLAPAIAAYTAASKFEVKQDADACPGDDGWAAYDADGMFIGCYPDEESAQAAADEADTED